MPRWCRSSIINMSFSFHCHAAATATATRLRLRNVTPCRDVGCWVTNDRTIARLNAAHRGQRGPTDILSFAFPTPLPAPEAFPAAVAAAAASGGGDRAHGAADELNLGDLVISAPYIARNAESYRDLLDVRASSAAHADAAAKIRRLGAACSAMDVAFRVLLTHGVVHLLGYDHETDEQHAAMVAREAAIMAALDAAQLPSVMGADAVGAHTEELR
jgi:probable rRNA maturation factor